MIRYTLTCSNDHQFESWFQSAKAFDGLQQAGMITCAVCNSTAVTKTVMAPALGKSSKTLATPEPSTLERLRDEVEQNADYVGRSFASEARAIHDGEKPERAIYGEANAVEAKSLIEDGVPVLPLPFISRKRVN